MTAKKDIATTQTDAGMAMVQAAIDKGIEPAALEKLMDLAERQSAEVARRQWHEAMAAFQAEVPVISKDGEILGGKAGQRKYVKARFASYPQIMSTIRPFLARHHLNVSFRDVVNDNGSVTTTCLVSHIGGHVDATGSFTGPASAQLVQMSGYQESGAAQAYRKRYALIAALNLVTDEDNDAAEVSEPITESQAVDLAEAIEQSGIPLKRVLAWAGISRLEDMPASMLKEAAQRVATYAKAHEVAG